MFIAIVITAIIALAVGGFVGYQVGKGDGVNAGYSNGYDAAKSIWAPKAAVVKIPVKVAKAAKTPKALKPVAAKRGRPRKSK